MNEIELMKEHFQHFLVLIEDRMVDLQNLIQKEKGDDNTLDFSPKSIDIVEEFFSDYLDEKTTQQVTNDELITQIATYLGEMVRKNRKGKWNLCLEEDNYDFGYPRISNMEGLSKDFGWNPFALITNFMDNRKPNLLKSGTVSMMEFEL